MERIDDFIDDVEDIIEDVEEDIEDSWTKFKKSGFKWVLASFLILVFVFSLVPLYFISLDPSPKNIPSLSDVVPSDLSYARINSTVYSDYIIVDSEIKTIADNIAVSSCPSGSKVCHAKAMFYFVKDNLEYVSDPTAFEYVKTAKESLVNKGGDCDDASVLLSTFLNAVGINTRLVFVPGHVYVEAWIPEARGKYKSEDNWVPMDSTCQYCEFGEISFSSSKQIKSY